MPSIFPRRHSSPSGPLRSHSRWRHLRRSSRRHSPPSTHRHPPHQSDRLLRSKLPLSIPPPKPLRFLRSLWPPRPPSILRVPLPPPSPCLSKISLSPSKTNFFFQNNFICVGRFIWERRFAVTLALITVLILKLEILLLRLVLWLTLIYMLITCDIPVILSFLITQAEMQTERQRILLLDTSKTPVESIRASGRYDFIVEHDVKELGAHTWVCLVFFFF